MLEITRLQAMRQLKNEYKDLDQNPNMNIGATIGLVNEDDIFNWRVSLYCYDDTPYKGGLFFVSFHFPNNYPNSPPKVRFLTPIYHLNVNPKRNHPDPPGNVCLSILSRWNPNCKVEDILVSLHSLFYMTNPDSPYGLDRAIEFKENRNAYEEKVKFFTKKYADPDSKVEVDPNKDWDFTQ